MIAEQETNEENFVLLTENDLKDLGFLMGPRKMLLQWIGSGTHAGTSSTGTVAPLASPGMRQPPASATVANFKVRSF